MPFIQARPDEFLVTSRAGRLTNRGTGRSALVLPGATWVARVPLLQSSREGLR